MLKASLVYDSSFKVFVSQITPILIHKMAIQWLDLTSAIACHIIPTIPMQHADSTIKSKKTPPLWFGSSLDQVFTNTFY